MELAAEWINGRKIHSTFLYDSISVKGEASQRIRSFVIKPMIVLRNSGDLLSFYSKLGLAIAPYSKGSYDLSLEGNTNGQPFQLITSATESIRHKVGFTAAFGISFRVSQALAIAGEINGQMISLSIKDGHYTKYVLNGSDQLSNLSVRDKSWEYSKSISNAPGDPNQPE